MDDLQDGPSTGHAASPHVPTMDYRKDFVLPVVQMIGLAAATILFMLLWLAYQANEREFKVERNAASTAVSVHVDGMKQYLADCAAWDEALENLVLRMDHQWAAAKIGPYLAKSQGYENSFVIEPANRTTYASSGMHEARLDGIRYVGKPLQLAIASIRSMRPDKDRRIAGLTRTADGRVAAFAVAPIVSDTGKIASPPGGLSFLVLVDLLTVEDTRQIGISHQLERLRQTPVDRSPDLILRDPQGDAIGGLSWVPRRPGTVLIKSAGPIVLVVLTCLLLRARRLLGRARDALRDTRTAIGEMSASRELVVMQERKARQNLEVSIGAVKAENVQLNEQAEAARSLGLREAAHRFESQIAPILKVIHGNATALTSAAEAGRSRAEAVLASMNTATRSAARRGAEQRGCSRGGRVRGMRGQHRGRGTGRA